MTDKSHEQVYLNCLEKKLRQADDGEAAADIWKQMNAPICTLAQSVAARLRIRDKVFVDEASSIIFERYGKFDPGKGRFSGWCRTALKHWMIDGLRRRKRAPLTFGCASEGEDGYDPVAEKCSDSSPSFGEEIFDELFVDEDVERVEKWTLRDRIVLLTLSGLWVKISTEQWQTWCAQFGVDSGFPPNEVRVEDGPAERIRPLANSLEQLPNTVSQCWKRGMNKLRSLRLLREHSNND